MANNWAIVIGINHYDHHSERQLKYAVADAQLMCDFLCNHAGFDRDRILLCLGDEEQRSSQNYPTYPNLLRLLNRDLRPDRIGQVDRFWFFFGGHGVSQNGRDYLLTSDSLLEDIEWKIALPIDEVVASLRKHQTADIVLILDSCRQQKGSRKFVVDDIGKQTIALAQSRGITTIFSCDYGQSSYELDSLKQGAFTYALVEGLKQYTLPDKLEPYLRSRVAELNQRSDQIPRIRVEPAAKALQPLLPGAVTAADITVLVDRAREAELEENLELAKQVWWQIVRVAKSGDWVQEAEIAIRRIDQKTGDRSVSVPVTPSIDRRVTDRSMVNRQLTRQQFLKWAIPAGVGVVGVTIASQFSGKQSQPPSSKPASVTPTLAESPAPPTPVSPSPMLKSSAIISPAEVQSFTEKLKDGVMMEMAKIPGGKFQMGSLPTETGYHSEESPQHEVTVTKFAIGKYPVTQAQWRVVAALPAVNRNLNLAPAYFQNPNHPVEQISWLDAIEFCARLSQSTERLYRLPTEAEWEYACRSGTTTPYSFGETLTKELANYSSTATTPVGSFTANAFGLHDMHGNVWECCADYWRKTYEAAPLDGSAQGDPDPNLARVIRGGSWASEAAQCRSAKRTWYVESTTWNLVFKRSEFGMRVACSV